MSKITNIFKKTKPKVKSDEFDDRFGFILKHRIDNKKNYNMVKSHYFHTLSASAKDNVHYSVKGLL